MKMKSLLVTLLFVSPLAVSAAAEARMKENTALPQACGSEGCEVPAPPWSAACMTRKSAIIPTVGNRMWPAGNQTCDTEEVCYFAAAYRT